MRFLREFLCLFVFALCAIVMAGAQENGTITGVVTDQSGAAVPGVTITVTQTSTGEVRTTQSSASGLYEIPGLAIGTYNLKAAKAGFKNYTKTGIVVNEAATVRADVRFSSRLGKRDRYRQANALQVQIGYQRSQFADHRRAGSATRHQWPQHDVADHCWAPALPIRCPPSTVLPPRAAAPRSTSTAAMGPQQLVD